MAQCNRERDDLTADAGGNRMEMWAKESESLVTAGGGEKNCSGKRVNLFGSID